MVNDNTDSVTTPPESSQLSPEQQHLFDIFCQGHNIFMTGGGGAGKTYMIKKMHKWSNERRKKIQICALTGCAALLIECNAKTVHSFAGIKLGEGTIAENVRKILDNSFICKTWRDLNILVIDEVSMMSKKLFEMLDSIAKAVRKDPRPFGGIQIVCSGDFYQLQPVGSNLEPDTKLFAFESPIWDKTFNSKHQIELKEIKRQTDPTFIKILNEIRKGLITKSAVRVLESRVGLTPPENIAIPEIYALRAKVDEINRQKMAELPGNDTVYTVTDALDLPIDERKQLTRANASEQNIAFELTYMRANLNCDTEVRLRIGAHVMCIVNKEVDATGFYDEDEGMFKFTRNKLVNGSLGIVIGWKQTTVVSGRKTSNINIPVVRFNAGFDVAMTPHVWESSKISGIGISQIPLILAWAITIHKMQGATVDYAKMDLGSSIFACGQTYVGLSRVKSIDGLYLTNLDVTRIRVNKRVREFYERMEQRQVDDLPSEVENSADEYEDIPVATAVAINCVQIAVPVEQSDPDVRRFYIG